MGLIKFFFFWGPSAGHPSLLAKKIISDFLFCPISLNFFLEGGAFLLPLLAIFFRQFHTKLQKCGGPRQGTPIYSRPQEKNLNQRKHSNNSITTDGTLATLGKPPLNATRVKRMSTLQKCPRVSAVVVQTN